MSARIRISRVTKTPRFDPWDRIDLVGGTQRGAGAVWKLDQATAIARIEDGTYDFYVGEDGNTVDVIVATHSGHEHLTTETDDLHPENLLLFLPECP